MPVELGSLVLRLRHFFFFNDTATTEIYPLSLHDALPISGGPPSGPRRRAGRGVRPHQRPAGDRKSTRLNSSHSQISHAVFCLKKKKSPRVVATLAACDVIHTCPSRVAPRLPPGRITSTFV